MSVRVFECVTLVASNDTTNGGQAFVSCYSDPVNLNDSECLSVQATVDSIWGAGTANPELKIEAEFSANGVGFGDPVEVPQLTDLDAAGTKIGSLVPCGDAVRLKATFTLDTAGTTGPGAVTFSAFVSPGTDGL